MQNIRVCCAVCVVLYVCVCVCVAVCCVVCQSDGSGRGLNSISTIHIPVGSKEEGRGRKREGEGREV